MSNTKIMLVFGVVLSLLFVAGYLASDRRAATDKASAPNAATTQAADPNVATTQADDPNVATTRSADPNVTIDKAPDKNVAAAKPLDKGLTLNLGRKVTMKFLLLPAGEFMMGGKLSAEEVVERFALTGDPAAEVIKISAADFTDEHPRHRVTIGAPFYMGVTEVTQRQWKAVMRSQPWSRQAYTRDEPDHAAGYISWNDATAFCKSLSKKTKHTVRLPTEAEWEYACRAGTTTAFSFGDASSELGDYAWYRGNTYEQKEKYAHSAGAKKPNAWGLYDMHGNVYEWCADWYSDSYATGDTSGPTGPRSGKERVARGGSWRSVPPYCRAARRTRFAPDTRFDTFGFRVVIESGSGAD